MSAISIRFVREVAHSFKTATADERDSEDLVLRLPRRELQRLTERAQAFGYASRADYIADALSLYEFLLNEIVEKNREVALLDADGDIVDVIELK